MAASYALYRALAISARALNPLARPDLHQHPSDGRASARIRNGPSPGKIVSLDPWGHMRRRGLRRRDRRRHGHPPDHRDHQGAPQHAGDPRRHGRGPAARRTAGSLHASGDISVTKIAIDPVWHLPGVAARFGVAEQALRRTLFEQTGGMFPELVTRPDMDVFLPPIGGMTVYIMGEVARARPTPKRRIACRVHDECNGSDVFGSDICTCRPYLVHGIEECVREAQKGGVGVIVYNRKEGRALGEVTKFLVYNARKRQEGGDRAATYFERTECVAGVQDMRFQQLMPDVLHWLGIRRIDRLVSMSNMKYDAIVGVRASRSSSACRSRRSSCRPTPRVEIEAKKAAGYYTPDGPPDAAALGRGQGTGSGAVLTAGSAFSVKVSAVAVSITTPPTASAQPNGSCA